MVARILSDVRVDLTDRNEAPTKTDDDIPDQRILVGLTLCPIDADDHFMDPDHRDQQAGLLIDVSSTRPGDAEVSVGPGNEICIKGRKRWQRPVSSASNCKRPRRFVGVQDVPRDRGAQHASYGCR